MSSLKVFLGNSEARLLTRSLDTKLLNSPRSPEHKAGSAPLVCVLSGLGTRGSQGKMKPWGTVLLDFMDTNRLTGAGCPLTRAPGAPQALSKGVLGQEPRGGAKKIKKKELWAMEV